MKKNIDKQRETQSRFFVKNEEIYWSFMGQLCYTNKRKLITLNMLSLMEHSLCIYFNTLVEYFEVKLDVAIKNYDSVLAKMTMINLKACGRGKSECIQCGGCCWTWPCCVTQSDITRISEYMEISESDFIENYTVIVDGIRTVRRSEWEDVANTVLYGYRVYDIKTPCVFYDESIRGCKIHRVKPDEGREYNCWELGTAMMNEIKLFKFKDPCAGNQ